MKNLARHNCEYDTRARYGHDLKKVIVIFQKIYLIISDYLQFVFLWKIISVKKRIIQ